MKDLYVVVKEGVYRHELGGVFSTKEYAIGAANSYAENDSDDYHRYAVIPFNLDFMCNQTPLIPERNSAGKEYFSGGYVEDPEPIYSVRKGEIK